MLKDLYIKNYALIRELQMQPDKELNIITGETGAGKSIMLGAIGLLLGRRADTKSLLDEGEKCIIEGNFLIEGYNLQSLFANEDLDYDSLCIIRREISPSGKSRAFINDTPVRLETLKGIGEKLMDIHSQHETLTLGDADYQLTALDTFAKTEPLLKSYKQHYNSFIQHKKTWKALQAEAEAINQEKDYHQFLFDELANARLVADEQFKLEESLETLEHAEEIKLKLHEAAALLEEQDFSIIGQLQQTVQLLQSAARLSPRFEPVLERLNSASIELRDIYDTLQQESTEIEYNPEKIQEAQERLDLIYQLQQKHRVDTVAALLQLQQTLEEKLNKAANMEDAIADAKDQMEEAEQSTLAQGATLTKARASAIPTFEKSIEALLSTLGMTDAKLQITQTAVPPQQNGVDEINFLFAANKGSKPQPLKKVASGGEFSRLMFCIKYLLADKTLLPTIIFDEIDTGISGEIALKMAVMMKEMAKNHQVIVISHLPQIAARGHAHYFVYKDNSADKTISKIRKLNDEERIDNIAKMIGGDQPGPAAIQSAKDLMLSIY